MLSKKSGLIITAMVVMVTMIVVMSNNVQAQTTIPQPFVTVTSSNVTSSDVANPIPQFVMFEIEGGDVMCPNGITTTGNVYTTNTREPKQYNALAISDSDSDSARTGLFHFNAPKDSSSVAVLDVRWVEVDPTGQTYVMRGMIHDDHNNMCPAPHDIIFDVEIRGTCDGSIFSLTTPNINGYSIVASGIHIDADCMYP